MLKAHEVPIGNAALQDQTQEEIQVVSNYIDDIDQLDKMNASIVFRCYATLTIFMIVDKDSESNLAILDLI